MLARCLLAEDRAAEAVAVLKARLADAPDSAALQRAIAAAYQAAGDPVAALDHLARAFALDPDDHASGRAATTTALALAAAAGNDDLAAGFHARALELAAKLATAAPEYENDLLAGEAAFGAGQLEVAAGWFAEAVKKRPQEPVARYHLGRTLAELDRNDEAIGHLRAALGAAPDAELAVRIHGQLGRLLACRLELPEAARHYRAAGDDEHAGRIDELAASFDDGAGTARRPAQRRRRDGWDGSRAGGARRRRRGDCGGRPQGRPWVAISPQSRTTWRRCAPLYASNPDEWGWNSRCRLGCGQRILAEVWSWPRPVPNSKKGEPLEQQLEHDLAAR